MLVQTTHSKINKIIEAAGNNIRVIVDLMNPESEPTGTVPATLSGDDFETRFECIKDLNIVSAMGSDHLETSPEFADRYPFAAIFIDEVRSEGGPVHFRGSLGVRVEVQGETFAVAQREIHEIMNAIRSIIFMDQSFGEYGSRGGVIDVLEYSGFADASFLVDDLDNHILGLTQYYVIHFSEQVIR